MAKQKQSEIIKDAHEAVGQSTHSKALASHENRDSTYSEISKRFFSYSIYKMLNLTSETRWFKAENE